MLYKIRSLNHTLSFETLFVEIVSELSDIIRLWINLRDASRETQRFAYFPRIQKNVHQPTKFLFIELMAS